MLFAMATCMRSSLYRKHQKYWHINVTVQTGLYISEIYPYLGAKPDAVINGGLLEVKCPYTGKDMEIVPANEFAFLEFNDSKYM